MTQDCQGDIGAGGQEDHKDRVIMEDRVVWSSLLWSGLER